VFYLKSAEESIDIVSFFYTFPFIRNASSVLNIVYATHIPRTAYLDIGQQIVQSPFN